MTTSFILTMEVHNTRLCARSFTNACRELSKIKRDRKNVDLLNIIYIKDIVIIQYLIHLRFLCVCRLALFLSRFRIFMPTQVTSLNPRFHVTLLLPYVLVALTI